MLPSLNLKRDTETDESDARIAVQEELLAVIPVQNQTQDQRGEQLSN